MCNLGDMYSYEDGLTIDYEKAFYWYEKSRRNKKHSRALTELGDMYYAGKGVRQDYQKAMEYYQKACDEGYPYAFYSLRLYVLERTRNAPPTKKRLRNISVKPPLWEMKALSNFLNRMDHESEEKKTSTHLPDKPI